MRNGSRGPAHLRILAISVAVLAVWLPANGTEPVTSQRPDADVKPALRSRLVDSYGQLPLVFERNTGQTDGRVKFLSRGQGYAVFLTRTGAVLHLAGRGSGDESAFVRMALVGANPDARIVGLEELAGKANYLIGNDPRKWRTSVPTYATVKYVGVYPDIDLVYYGNQRQLEYDFVLAPGSDPEAITLELTHSAGRGAELRIDPAGDLVMRAAAGEVRFRKPIIYQADADGEKRFVEGKFVRKGTRRVGFAVAGYDRTRPLIIDPTVIYSTLLGGSGQDEGVAITVDADGNAYVTGTTRSLNFPATGAVQATLRGGSDVFVAKLNATGSALVYCTYLGGTTFNNSNADVGRGIAVDASNNVYVTGDTNSTDFPTTPGARQTIYGGGPQDVFVAKLDASGTFLAYSTYIGGSNQELGRGIAVDAAGNAYVTGLTTPPCCGASFPTTAGAFQSVHPSTTGTRIDAFVTKLNGAGSDLVYSTLLGGMSWDEAFGIAVDSAGSAYVTGFTNSSNFPTTPDAFQPAISVNPGSSFPAASHRDVFVTKLDITGSFLVYSTFLGGTNQDEGRGIAVDGAGNAYVTGLTASSNLTTTAGAFQTTLAGGGFDAFVTKVHSAGSSLDYSTYLGGSTQWDLARAIAVDTVGNAWVTGLTRSPGFPTTADAFQRFFTTPAGWGHAFVTKLNAAGSALSYSSFLGNGCSAGCAETEARGIAVDGAGGAYVTGDTNQGFPATAGAFQRSSAGGVEAFVTKFFVVSENRAPAIAADIAAVNVDEGSAASMTGTYSDPDAGNDVAITASAGTVTKTGTGTGTWSWSFAAQDGPLPTQTITVTADDGRSEVATTTFDLTVNNVPPAPTISGPPATATEGAPVAASASAIDASPVDAAAGFGFSWSVTGNGSPFASGSGANFSFTPDDDGTYLVTVAATDKDGGSGGLSASVTVSNAAPAILSLTGPSSPLALGTAASLTAAFSDAGTADTHTCSIRWDALSTSSGTVTESSGSGTCTASHVYASAGVYTATVTVTDDEGGAATQVFEYVVVYDPAAGFVTGHGKIESPAGAYALDLALAGDARFGFVSRYRKGATVPSGKTEFHFAIADFHFASESYQWLVVSGPLAQYKGDGDVNGSPGYSFLLTATDGDRPGGGGVDEFRIKIWNTASGAIVYDNRVGAPDEIAGADPTPITSGNIVIHTK